MKSILKFLGRMWTREKPDGKKGWGALRYLVVGGIVFGLGFWTISRMQGNSAASRAAAFTGSDRRVENPAAKDVRIGEVAAAAQKTEPVRLEGKQDTGLARSEVGMSLDNATSRSQPSPPRGGKGDSFFGGSARSSGPSVIAPDRSSNDSIFAALNSAESAGYSDGRPPLNEDGAAPVAPAPVERGAFARSGFGTPTVDGNDPDSQRPNLPPIESLVVQDSAVSKAAEAAARQRQPGPPARTAPTHFLPRGEIIPVYIMQTVETGRFPTLIEFAVAKTVWFNGKPVLPFGTRFTATAGVGVRDRITFNVDSVRRRDGLEIALSGMVLGEDKATGMRSYFIPPPTMAQVAPYIGDFAQAFADIARANLNNVSLQVGNVSVQSQPSLSQQTREIAAASASQALSTFMAGQLADIRERYAAYSTVIAGSRAYVQLTANTDLSALWDESPRGELRTVGTPVVVDTDALYRARATEQQQDQMFASMLAQGGAPFSIPEPAQPPAPAPASTLPPGGSTAPTIPDPFAR